MVEGQGVKEKEYPDCDHGDDEGIDITKEFAFKFPVTWKEIQQLVAEIEAAGEDPKSKNKS